MKSVVKLLVFITAIVFCMKEAATIKCYECNSHNDTRCAYKDMPEEFLKDCSTKDINKTKNFTLCRKIKQSIDFELNGLAPETRIIRACGYVDTSYKNACYQRSGFGSRQEVCSCDGDGCNSGSSFAAFFGLIFGLCFFTLKI